MPRSTRKTYYPARTFDDDLTGFVQLAKEHKWSFSGVDFKQLEKDSVEQRAERTDHDALEGKWNHVHETFGLSQETRHARFSAALDAARGAFKNDKAVMAQLNKFKRSAGRRSVKKDEEPK